MKYLALAIIALLAALPAAVRADIPNLGPYVQTFTADGSLPVLRLAGQSSCAMTLSGSGSATITPNAASDGGTNYSAPPNLPAQTNNGTYGGIISPFLTNYYVAISSVTGTVTASEICTAATGLPNVYGTLTCTIAAIGNACTATATVPAGSSCTAAYSANTAVAAVSLRPILVSVSGTTLTLSMATSTAAYDPLRELAYDPVSLPDFSNMVASNPSLVVNYRC